MKFQALTTRMIVAFIGLFFCAGHAQDKEGLTQLYNAAKKDGRVIIWGPTDAIVLSTNAGTPR